MLNNHSIKKSYIVCSTMRTGSTLLCRTLAKLGDCGNARQYFSDSVPIRREAYYENPDKSFTEYYMEVLEQATTPNGIFGLKTHFKSLYKFLSMVRSELPELQEKSDWDILEYLFPNPHFIYLSRSDVLGQAISALIAQQTQIWVVPVHKKRNKNKARSSFFRPLSIYRNKINIYRDNQEWEKFFQKNSIKPYRINYEDLVPDIELVVRNIYSLLDIGFEHSEISLPLEKQADKTNDQYKKYYEIIPEKLIVTLDKLLTEVKETCKNLVFLKIS